MAQFYEILFLIGIVVIVHSTVAVEYATLESLLADKIFEIKVSGENDNGTRLEGQMKSFKKLCSAASERSRFVMERKICQSYPVINFNRCRIPNYIYMTRCCTTQVRNNLECREVFYSIQVLKSSSCNSNNPKDYRESNITIPVSCVCVLPRLLPGPMRSP